MPSTPASTGSTPRPKAVDCRAVQKSYGTGQAVVRALRGVDLDVYSGELLMLVGPSGCGKTTLISIIAGVLDRDAGECRVFDQDFEKLSPSARVRFRGKTIGFVFQSFNLIPTLTIAENVAVPLLLQGVSRSEAIDRARAILDKVGLGDRWRDSSNKLSGGQQQRVAISRAIVHSPKLIVCDEPTSALDHATGEKVMELLKEAAVGEGRSLIVVTHDNRIFQHADRIAHMDDGRIDKIVTDPSQL
ncbi:MAG: ABC transporter ATP-binding protein [Tepidisphaera sp.]